MAPKQCLESSFNMAFLKKYFPSYRRKIFIKIANVIAGIKITVLRMDNDGTILE